MTREELYELVWSNPMTVVAKEFDLSSSYMARVCAALHIPKPERGYWAKLAIGKASEREVLPEAQPGDQLHWSRDGGLQSRLPLRGNPRYQRHSGPSGPAIDRDHFLILGARQHFENSRPVSDGAYLKPYKKALLDVTTSKPCLDKSLAFARALYKSLEVAGHRVLMAPSGQGFHRGSIDEHEERKSQHQRHANSLWFPDRPTLVYVGTVAIGLSIVEMSEATLMRYVGSGNYIRDSDYIPPRRPRGSTDYTWTTTREAPCGRLRLVAYSPYSRVSWSTDWQETKTSPLDQSLGHIVKAIAEAAAELAVKLEDATRKAEIAHREWLEAEERRRQEEDRRWVEQSVNDSRDHLGQIIRQWAEIMSIEQFLKGVEENSADMPQADQEKVRERLELAPQFLGRQDPLSFFMSWKTPAELYESRFRGDEE